MLIQLATIRQIAVLTATAIAFSVTGCGDDEEPVAPAPEKTAAAAPETPAAEPGTVLIPKRKEQAAAPKQTIRDELRNEVPRPDNFPADAPVYPGSTTNHTLQVQNVLTVTFSTSDDPGQVSTFITDELGSAGWDQIRTEAMPNSGGTMTYGFKTDRSISVLIAPLEQGTPDAVTMIMMRIEG